MVKITYHKLFTNSTKKTFIKFIKPVILIASFMTFLYLVINTVNSNALVVKKPSDNSDNSILDDVVRDYGFDKYNDKFVKSVINDLELVPSLYVEDQQNFEICEENKADYQNLITSLPGNKLIDFIWEYISLWSLSSQLKKLKQTSNIYLSDKTINGLTTLFDIDCLKIPPISSVPRKCFNLSLIKVLRPTDKLNLKDYTEDVPFILEKKSKRVFDIVSADLKPLRAELQIQSENADEADAFLTDITNSMSVKRPINDGYKYVCSYIDERQENYLPYIKSAIEFHNKEGTSNIFIFFVHPNDYQLYTKALTNNDETIKVIKREASESFYLSLLLQCHRTIILNEYTWATALLNAGVATIPRDDPVFILFKSKIYNWYALSNGDDNSE